MRCFVFVVFVAFSFIFLVFVVAGEYLRLALRRCGPLGARETGGEILLSKGASGCFMQLWLLGIFLVG